MKQHEVRNYMLYGLRSVVMCGLFWAIFKVTCLFLSFSCHDIGAEKRLIDGGCTLVFVAVLNTVLGKFAQFDRREKHEFLRRSDDKVGFSAGAEIKQVMCSHRFWIEAATFALFPPSWGMDFLSYVVFGQADVLALAERLLIIAVTLPLVVGLNLASYIEARRIWIEEGAEKKGDPAPVLKLIKWLIMGTVMYCLGFFVLPYVIPTLLSVLHIVRVIEAWRILPVIAVVALAFVALTYLRALLHRRRFIRRLRRFCREQHFELSRIRYAYRSVFRQNSGASFTVVAHKKIYACKLIASVKRSNPIDLTDDGQCLHTFRFRFKHMNTELFRIVNTTDYQFEEKGTKILVVTPVPKKLFFDRREMDNGDRIGEYTVFSGGGLLGALERDCVERCGTY